MSTTAFNCRSAGVLEKYFDLTCRLPRGRHDRIGQCGVLGHEIAHELDAVKLMLAAESKARRC